MTLCSHLPILGSVLNEMLPQNASKFALTYKCLPVEAGIIF